MFVVLPEEVLLLDDDITVATYADDGAVQYENLDQLLKDHAPRPRRPQSSNRVPGLGRWDP